MSIKLASRVWELDVSGSARDIIHVLCDHANDDGICWPSVPTIAWKIGSSERTVQRHLSSFMDTGIIEVIEHVPGGKRVFRVHLDRITPKQDKPGRGDTATSPPTECHPRQNDMSPVTQLCQGGGDIQVSPEPSEEPSKKPSRVSRRAVRTPIPEDFALTEERVAVATGEGLTRQQAELQFKKFRNSAIQNARTYANWDMAWSNWILGGIEKGWITKPAAPKPERVIRHFG